MSDIHNEEGSYLTTDAVPDKPRKNVPEVIISEEKADQSEENKSVPSSPVHTTKPKPTSSPTASNRTSKPKKKPCSSPRSTHATAKVINVVQSHGVHVGTVNNYNLYSNVGKAKQEKPKEAIYRTEEIDQILANNNAVTTEHINFVSTHLGEEWRAVGKNLGYSKGQMDHFYADNKDTGIKEVVYQMLLDWIRMNPEESKIRDLARVLWDTDQKEVVQRWTKIL